MLQISVGFLDILQASAIPTLCRKSMYFFLFFLLRLSTAHDDCSPTRCSHHGPTIRFPFRLKNQPQHCGYPGFDLSCSPNTTTVLDLPNSVKVLVAEIDYKSRLIHIKDPNSCFPRQLQNLNLSTTSFKFTDSVHDFSLFSCPVKKRFHHGYTSYPVTCLGGAGHEVYPFYRDTNIYPTYVAYDVVSCRKMYSLSVPNKAFDQPADLQLTWPHAVCGKCEAVGKFCRSMSNNTREEIECFGDLNPHS